MSTSQMPTVHAGDEPSRPHVRGDGSGVTVLGRFSLAKRLGSGAFGTVWAARDERLERDVAVKILPRERVIFARFEREARAAARLQHPAIVTLYEAAVDDEGAYLVSELVRGRTLEKLLDEGKLSDRDILEVGVTICDALAHAHALGVIHRDVKPSNVLVSGRQGQPAKLTDFGVAHIVGGDSLTRTGDVIGTLAYMAPEQAEGRDTGPPADLYALAVVLYEALTGVNPLREAAVAGRRRRLGIYLPPVRRQRRDLPRALGAGLDRALRPRPRERGTVDDLRDALAASLRHVGEQPGVVVAGGWGPTTDTDEQEPGPEWREEPELGRPSGARAAAGLQAGGVQERFGTPVLLERAIAAATAGPAAAWIASNLHGRPVAPAAIGLVVALAALLVPRIGLGLGAVALGAIGLAGAWPALIGRTVRSWWSRALLGAWGFLLLAEVSALTGHDLYWRGPPLGAAIRSGALAAALVWAVFAAVLPLLVRGRRFVLDLALSVVLSAMAVSAVQACGARALHGAVLGAVVGAVIMVMPALLAPGGQRPGPVGDQAPVA